MKNGKEIHNEKDIAELFQQEIPLPEGIVIKADAGTHGKMIMLAKTSEELIANIQETKPSIINPVGVVAQELIDKVVLRFKNNRSQRKRQTAHLLPYSDGKSRL